MKTLEISVMNAHKAYLKADGTGRELLLNLFGKETFSENLPITEYVKTFEDACHINSTTHVEPSFDLAEDTKAVLAYYKLIIIARALNEGWEPNWDDSNEYKYYPWFRLSGSGFSVSYYDYSDAITYVGSRLCFKTKELALYAGKQFEELYKDYFLLN